MSAEQRIKKHPILSISKKRKIHFYWNSQKLKANEGEVISSALFVTIPRMGYVNFTNARKAKERRKMSFWLVLGIVVFGAVLVGLAKRNILPGLDSVPQAYPLLALAVIFSSLIIAAALMFGAVHLYAYAALVLVVLVPFQSIYAPEPHRVTFAGALILLCGLLTFIRFLRKYPLPEKEVYDVNTN